MRAAAWRPSPPELPRALKGLAGASDGLVEAVRFGPQPGSRTCWPRHWYPLSTSSQTLPDKRVMPTGRAPVRPSGEGKGCSSSTATKTRKRLYDRDASVICLRPRYPNHIWSVETVYDRLINGRRYEMLMVLDEFTRQVLCVRVATKMGTEEVLDALYPLMIQVGRRPICAPTMARNSSLKRSRRG